jgi:hypothetical protein
VPLEITGLHLDSMRARSRPLQDQSLDANKLVVERGFRLITRRLRRREKFPIRRHVIARLNLHRDVAERRRSDIPHSMRDHRRISHLAIGRLDVDDFFRAERLPA